MYAKKENASKNIRRNRQQDVKNFYSQSAGGNMGKCGG